MANEYFNAPATPVDFTPARASAVRALFGNIAAAFDLLPTRDALLQGRVNYAVAGGDGNALTANFTVNPTAYVDGASYRLRLTNTNTGAATLAIGVLGVKNIKKSDGSALTGGELVAGAIQDFTYNSATGTFQLPATGPAGPQGPIGPASSSTVLNGAANPLAGQGNNGDFFINTVSWQIFGPKAGGAWPAGVNLVGAAGANGTNGTNGNTVLYGAGAPAVGTGVAGNFYIDTNAPKTLYGPKTATWPAGVSLKGDTGATGAPGAPGVIDTAASYNFTGPSFARNGWEVGFLDLVFSQNTAGNMTVALADRDKGINYSGAGGHSVTVPLNATVALPGGQLTIVLNNGSGNLTLAREAGVTMKWAGNGGSNANRTLAAGGVAWLWKIDTDTWYVGGVGLT